MLSDRAPGRRRMTRPLRWPWGTRRGIKPAPGRLVNVPRGRGTAGRADAGAVGWCRIDLIEAAAAPVREESFAGIPCRALEFPACGGGEARGQRCLTGLPFPRTCLPEDLPDVRPSANGSPRHRITSHSPLSGIAHIPSIQPHLYGPAATSMHTAEMRILEISSALGSTLMIANHLREQFRKSGNECAVIAPVHGHADLAVSLKLWRLRRQFHVNHVHLGHAAVNAGRVMRLTRIPTVATLHGFNKFKHYRPIEHFTAVSWAVKDHFVRQGASADRIVVVPNGFSGRIADYQGPSIRNELGIEDETLLIGSVGQLTVVKNHTLLLQAFAEALRTRSRMALAIAGEGPLEAQLRQQAAALGVADKTFFLGFRQNVAAVYKGIDVLVQTSHSEGFGMPLLEAMACARPVVTTTCGGPQDFVRNGDNGLVLEHGSAQELAELILRFADSVDLRRGMGLRAVASVQEMTCAKIGARYLAYFEHIRTGLASSPANAYHRSTHR